MSYIDGFIIAVPTANKQKFIEYGNKTDNIFTEFGATRVDNFGDERMDPKKNPMPFDGARLIYGGFKPVVEL